MTRPASRGRLFRKYVVVLLLLGADDLERVLVDKRASLS